MTLADQLAVARREVALRERCYPDWIQSGRMKPDLAEFQLEGMREIVRTLEKLKLLEEVSDEMRGPIHAEGLLPMPTPVSAPAVTHEPTPTPEPKQETGDRQLSIPIAETTS